MKGIATIKIQDREFNEPAYHSIEEPPTINDQFQIQLVSDFLGNMTVYGVAPILNDETSMIESQTHFGMQPPPYLPWNTRPISTAAIQLWAEYVESIQFRSDEPEETQESFYYRQFAISNTPHLCLEENAKALLGQLATGLSAILENHSSHSLYLKAQEYATLLSAFLKTKSYSQATEFEVDPYGGYIIDFLSSSNHTLTCIVAEKTIQMLSILDEQLESELFIDSASTKSDVLHYVKELLE